MGEILYDSLVGQQSAKYVMKENKDENGQVVNRYLDVIKEFSHLKEITPKMLQDVIARTLSLEHEYLKRYTSLEPIFAAREFASSTVPIFAKMLEDWKTGQQHRLDTVESTEQQQIKKWDESYRKQIEVEGLRWQNFSVWWLEEQEKEGERRGQWEENEMLRVQRAYYEEAERRATWRIRHAILDDLEAEAKQIILAYVGQLEDEESKRINQIEQLRFQFESTEATHRVDWNTTVERIKEQERHRQIRWLTNPFRWIIELVLILCVILTFPPYVIVVAIANSALAKYCVETYAEMKKVNWPTRSEGTNLTRIILTVIISMSAFLGFVDYIATTGLRLVMTGNPVAVGASVGMIAVSFVALAIFNDRNRQR